MADDFETVASEVMVLVHQGNADVHDVHTVLDRLVRDHGPEPTRRATKVVLADWRSRLDRIEAALAEVAPSKGA